MSGNGQASTSEDEGEQTRLVSWETLVRLLALSGGRDGNPTIGINRIAELLEGDDENEDDDEYVDEGHGHAFRHILGSRSESRQSAPPLFPPVTEPKEEGTRLLMGGEFGRIGNKMRARENRFNLPLAISQQAYTQRPVVFKEDYDHDVIPNTNGTTVAEYAANVYTGQYSQDSSFYYTCSQDFELHIYDTTQPLTNHARNTSTSRQRSYRGAPRDSVTTRLTVKQSIQGKYGGWTITDANVSPDNERSVVIMELVMCLLGP
ncbi:hypothetical protein HDZ31DRAFT_69349 [Schizophyllum fasciatum]